MSFEIPRQRQPVEAWKFALAAHMGQHYGDGKVLPMAYHLKEVAAEAWERGYRQPEIHATIPLHDTIEDTKTMERHLWAAGFSAIVVPAVVAISRVPGESPEEHTARVIANPLSHVDKICDAIRNGKSAHENAHLYLNPEDALEDQVKYDDLVTVLSNGLPTPDDIDDWIAMQGDETPEPEISLRSAYLL